MRVYVVLALFTVVCNLPQAAAAPVGTLLTTGDPIATVNGEVVTQDMLDALISRMPPQQVEMLKSSGQLHLLKDRLVLGQLLYKEALKRGMEKDADVKLSLGLAQRDVLAAALLERVAEEGITEEELKEAYDARAAEYKQPEVKARHILVKEEGVANDLLAKLKAGGDFIALAGEFSIDSGSKGGALGWFPKGRMVPPFEDAAFSANKGDIVGPIKSRFGYHLIEVLDKRDAVPLDDVREELKRSLQGEVVQDYLDKLKSDATIEYLGEDARPAELP